MTVHDIASRIENYAFRFRNEFELHAAIEEILEEIELDYMHETLIGSGDRIDFLLPDSGIGIEAKVDGSIFGVTRQLLRYASYAEVTGLALVTNRSKHLSIAPVLNGKPVAVALVGGGV